MIVKARLAALLTLALAAPARAGEGMWMPQQMTLPDHAEAPRGARLRGRREALRRAHRPPLGRDRVARRLHGVVRVARGPDRHEPPLRAGRARSSTRPRSGTWSRTASSRKTRATRSAGGPGARVLRDVRRSRTSRTRCATGSTRSSDAERGKEDRESALKAAHRARARRTAGLRCTVASFFGGARWYQLIEKLEIRDVRLVYAPAARRRQLRRRDRQLDVAAPHRRLLVLPRVRRQGRQARPLRGTTCRTSRSTSSRCRRGASPRATSCSWPGTRAAPSASRPIAR